MEKIEKNWKCPIVQLLSVKLQFSDCYVVVLHLEVVYFSVKMPTKLPKIAVIKIIGIIDFRSSVATRIKIGRTDSSEISNPFFQFLIGSDI